MRHFHFLIIGVVLLGLFRPTLVSAENDFAILRERHRMLVLEEERPTLEEVQELLRAQQDDGTWPHIDLSLTRPNGWMTWPPRPHAFNIVTLAAAIHQPYLSELDDAVLYDACDRAIKAWLKAEPSVHSWWIRDLGIPWVMCDALVLLHGHLSEENYQGLLKIASRRSQYQNGGNGTRAQTIRFRRACIEENGKIAYDASKRLYRAAKITEGSSEGIKPDFSYFLHGARMQSFHYGFGHIRDSVKIAWHTRGTRWAMPPEKRSIISNVLFEGMAWMERGRWAAWQTMCRHAARPMARTAGDMIPILQRWLVAAPEVAEQTEAFIARQQGTGAPLNGFRHFPYSDFTAYHRPQGSVFLRTASSRVGSVEAGLNGEYLLSSDRMNSGTHFIVQSGEEYRELMPVFDDDRLPGVTRRTRIRPHLAGGVGNGTGGLSTMTPRSTNKKGDIKAKFSKTWFFYNDRMTCLITDWMSPSNRPVVTSLEQTTLQAETLSLHNSDQKVQNDSTIPAGQWLLHGPFAYRVLGGGEGLTIRYGEQKGSWRRINKHYSDDPVVIPILQLDMIHGEKPQPGAYEIALSHDSLSETDPTILSNTPEVQAMQFTDGTVMAVFHQPGTIADITADRSCLVLRSASNITLADHHHVGGDIALTLSGKPHIVNLPADGQSVSIEVD